MVIRDSYFYLIYMPFHYNDINGNNSSPRSINGWRNQATARPHSDATCRSRWGILFMMLCSHILIFGNYHGLQCHLICIISCSVCIYMHILSYCTSYRVYECDYPISHSCCSSACIISCRYYRSRASVHLHTKHENGGKCDLGEMLGFSHKIHSRVYPE